MSTMLRLGQPLEILRPTLHNGPGYRLCIWFQGCSLRCTEVCINEHMLDAAGGYPVDVETVTDRIATLLQISDRELEGVSVLGGEPMDQPIGLAELLAAVQRMGLSTMLYTGHTLSSLRALNDGVIQRVLRHVDLLVDGPFKPDLYDERLPWRGSTNQQLHCLTSRYDDVGLQRAADRQGKAFSISVSGDGRVAVSGLQTRSAARRFASTFNLD